VYRAEFENGLVEHEYDHVFIGTSDALPKPDPAEARDWKYIDRDALLKDITDKPDAYTAWFQICMREVPQFRPALNQQ
jgi:isopentenyl-diphosphate delta-isomerase